MEDLKRHAKVVLGVAALLLGVYGAARGLNTYFFVFLTVFGIGFLKLKVPRRFWVPCVFFFFWGWQRYVWALPVFGPEHLAYYHSEVERQTFEAVVVDYPDARENQLKLTLEAQPPLSGRVLITTSRYPEYFYGDLVRVTGVVEAPADFEDFSYRMYLRRYGIDSVSYRPQVELVQSGARKDWRYFIFVLKARVEGTLNRLLPEPYASFAEGLLLGSRRGIPEETMEDFNTSGLTHIIAISGYNITLIIVFVSGLLGFLPQRARIVVSSGVIAAFVILVGASAAVVRAAIMGILALWAIWFGRRSEVTRLLALTAALMTLWNPFILVDDVGFQLSFAATCGLIYMTDSVQAFLKRLRLYDRIPEIFSIREAFVTTLAAQTFAVPMIWVHFERISLVAPFANVAVVSLIPLAMMTSFLALLFSVVSWPLASIFAYVSWFFLEAILQLAHASAQVPFASWGL